MKKTLLILFLSVALFSCKKEEPTIYGCVYEAPKRNYVEKFSKVGYYSMEQYLKMKLSVKYGKLIFVPSSGDCKEYYP